MVSDDLPSVFEHFMETTAEFVYILYVSFEMREGGEEEVGTDEVVGMMTEWIQQHSFHYELDGMLVEFTSLQVKHTLSTGTKYQHTQTIL